VSIVVLTDSEFAFAALSIFVLRASKSETLKVRAGIGIEAELAQSKDA
jgi:hypothetical protein